MECDKGRMVECELEAAEALAGLARSSSSRGGELASGELKPTESVIIASATQSQDQPVAAEQACDHAPLTSRSPGKAEKMVENIPSQLCSTSCQSNPTIKSSRKLTEALKEERKLRRILANRESARQTIRRRQAMYVELTRKAADVLEENENLKKEKELVMEQYNSVKSRNEFLKAQLAEVKKGEAGETEEEPRMSEAENSCCVTTSTPIFLHNHPSIVPCFWPSILPSSDVFPFQYPHRAHNASQSELLPMPQENIPCLLQGQEHSTGNARPGTPLFVVPVAWLLPLIAPSSTLPPHSSTNNRSNAHQCSKCSCLETRTHEDNHQFFSNQNKNTDAPNPSKNMSMESAHRAGLALPSDSGGHHGTHHPSGSVIVPGLFSPVRRLETLGPSQSCQADNATDAKAASAPESTRLGLSQTNQEAVICSHKKPEDVFAAVAARRRRKELMKLKNVHDHDVRTRY